MSSRASLSNLKQLRKLKYSVPKSQSPSPYNSPQKHNGTQETLSSIVATTVASLNALMTPLQSVKSANIRLLSLKMFGEMFFNLWQQYISSTRSLQPLRSRIPRDDKLTSVGRTSSPVHLFMYKRLKF
ncbi:hypothetical protein AT4G16955 [Arabidopsis thaliana]|uniref:Uncharacterized protein n=1 Tax=Arabidopsis thaliana TaxID=3702 RepID=A0A1P8B3C2_ARATH|nr:uncharacterized protein AT4G16955 [Arabidopsis thaliana]ANM66108.1 hypothetical protein AT4G16955 [Arabidopsis thaliana]|eukprot:NP_001328024.1 hypothetical protein AT4G16955 [Arabidopsis thaliana]